ncbi:hypothetical protein LWI29_030773 [Acer saccharum]|uniref:Uncharacterized protein n=1 Tax=Acer saccharum TaxID=4024 RepID=A0AA39W5P4_ACESA|nr:hypothetical protein LWI29_030773 [Acer saccharum]
MTLEGLSKLTSFCPINNNGVILEDTPTATFNGKNAESSEEDGAGPSNQHPVLQNAESSEEDGAGPSTQHQVLQNEESSEEDGAGLSTQHQVLQNTESSEEDGSGLSTQHLVLQNEESSEEDGAGPSTQHLENQKPSRRTAKFVAAPHAYNVEVTGNPPNPKPSRNKLSPLHPRRPVVFLRQPSRCPAASRSGKVQMCETIGGIRGNMRKDFNQTLKKPYDKTNQ